MLTEIINNVKDMLNPDTRELKKLRWVASARKYGDTYILHTKPNTLKIRLTKTIRLGDGSYDHKYMEAGSLQQPIVLYLPEYVIKLKESLYAPFEVKLKQTPSQARDLDIGVIPTYQHLVSAPKACNEWFVPCYGQGDKNVRKDYSELKTWREKANEVAMWLQTAEPHYGKLWYRTAFAYRLGLVGDKVIVNN